MKAGILCGIEREAGIARAALGGLPHHIICTGARAENARRGADTLISEGATHLISFGLAGALSDHLRPGDLLLPETVVDGDGQSWEADTNWRNKLEEALPGAASTPLLGLDKPARTAAQKLFLRSALDADAVDMESHFIARAAEAAGLPFIVVRAIADDSRTSLPDAALHSVSDTGRELPLNAVRGLIRRPRELPALIRLGLASGKGFRSLRRVARLGLAL